MENSWMMFDHVKLLHNWTILVCHVYNNKHYKVLIVICFDMLLEDVQAIPCYWRILMQSCSRMLKNAKG